MAPDAVPLVTSRDGPAPAHLTWVLNLLRNGTSLPEDALERTAGALCRSLRPSTLGDYIRFATVCERFMGAPLHTWVEMDEHSLHNLVTGMLALNWNGGTINSHLAAVGTFASWLNKPRPRSALVSYLIKGERVHSGPLPKARVH